MTRHRFHLDHAGHSITVDLRTGHTPEIELLVDGKEVGYLHRRGPDSTTLSSELPTDPPQPFTVRLDHLRHQARSPVCTLVRDDGEQTVPEEALA